MNIYKKILTSSAFLIALPLSAVALPSGENVVGGTVTFDKGAAKNLGITQTTARALIEMG